ncbi:hypothetical protein L0P17_24345, partial [Flavonifractor plautii]
NKVGIDKILLENQSLNYRFPLYLDFNGYNEAELYEICLDTLDNKGFILNEESYETLKNTMNELYNNKNILLK